MRLRLTVTILSIFANIILDNHSKCLANEIEANDAQDHNDVDKRDYLRVMRSIPEKKDYLRVMRSDPDMKRDYLRVMKKYLTKNAFGLCSSE